MHQGPGDKPECQACADEPTPDTITEPGWWDDMPEDVYYGDPVAGGSLSASMCKMLVRPGGPAKLRQQLDHGRTPKPEFDIGHAAHKLVLGVGAELEQIPFDEWRSKAAKEAVAAARESGRIPLKPVDYERVHRMADALDGCVAAHFIHALPEVSAFRQHDSGIWLRSRLDAVTDDMIIDYKTAASADPDVFARKAHDFGYHLQAAFYVAMADALPGLPDDPAFRFIVQEKEPPYLVSVIELDPDYLALGRADMERAIALWQECSAADQWPGYADRPVTVAPPPWLRMSATDDLGEMEPASLDPSFEAELARLAGLAS